jgi:hypothetical protein
MTEKDKLTLNTWQSQVLGKKYGPVIEEVLWRIRSNQEVKELLEKPDPVVGDMETKSLEF